MLGVNMSLCKCLVTFYLLSSFFYSHAFSQPQNQNLINRTLWSDRDLGVRFTYSEKWQRSMPTQSATNVVINWHAQKSNGLLGTCYLESSDKTSLAKANPSQIKNSAQSIADSTLRNIRQRAPDAEMLSWKSVVQDGHPAVYVVKIGTIQTFDTPYRLKVYSIVTSWRGKEIVFECVTTVFGPKFETVENGSVIIQRIENELLHVLRTLQFDR